MKNKFSKFINLQGKYLTSLLILLALSIGQMWATDVVLTPTAGEYTKGIPHKDGDLYFTRAGGKTKKVTISSKNYICPNECGFVFTLASESEIVLSTLRASGTSTCNTLKLIAATDMLETLYATANTNNKTLSAELVTWSSETGAKKAYYDEIGITSSSDNNNKILTGQTADAKFPVAEDVLGNTFSKPSSLGTATTSLGTYAAGTYLLYMGFGDSSLGLEKITLVPSSAVAPSISAPTTDQSATYTVGDVITALSITASGTPTPSYQWYYNSSASTTGATSLGSVAQTASYTPSNSVASDLYYYCIATNSAGSATSPYFHVTVNNPSTPTHGISYTNLKGSDVSSYPTTYYEGIGVASFDPLADVENFHFTGWDPASISDTEDQDVEVEAQWVAAYDVTFSAGAGSGTVPASFQKWETATFELPGQGSMVAPSGKAFDGWKANGTGDKLAANAEYTMGAAAVEFVAQWKKVPVTIFHWRADAGTLTTDAVNGTTTGGSVTLRSTDSGKTWSSESATYDGAVASDMKATTAKELKSGGNALYLELTLSAGTFQEGDVIYVTGYNPWSFATSTENIATSSAVFDVAASITTGSGSGAVNTGSAIIPAGVEAATIYARRANGSGSGIAAIKVTRIVKDVISTVNTLTDVKVGESSISAANLATLVSEHSLALSDALASAPTITFNKHTVVTYDDASTKTTDTPIPVVASDNGAGKWTASTTIDAVTYTVTLNIASGHSVIYDANGGSGTMTDANLYAEGQEVTVLANEFTAPAANQKFNGWSSSPSVTISEGKFNMPASDVTLSAQWKEFFTITYMDGAATLGTEEVFVGDAPVGLSPAPTKPLFSFDGWKDELDADVDVTTLTAAATVYAKWNKAFASSIDLEGLVESEGTGADWQAYLSGHNFNFSTSGVSLDEKKDPSENKAYDNWPYQGLKAKTVGAYVEGNIEANKLVIIKLGHMAAAANVTIGGVAAGTATGLDAAEPAGQLNYFYVENESVLRYETTNGGACVLKAITIQNPFEVSFDENGGDAAIAAMHGTPSVTLPTPTKGSDSFLGWFDALDNKIGDAGASYTPSANIELVAHWEAVSTDARLASIEFSAVGTLSPAFDPEVVNYTYTMPYPTAAVPTITGATSMNANAKAPVIDAQAANWGDVAHIHGVAQSDDTKDYYITMQIAPKDGVCLIKGKMTGDNAFSIDEEASLVSGTTSVSAVKGSSTYGGETGYKFNSRPAHLGLTLSEGTFQVGDVVEVFVTDVANGGGGTHKMRVFDANEATPAHVLAESVADMVQGANRLVLPATSTSSLYLHRGAADADYENWNPYVAYFAVYRPMNPMLTAITIDGRDGVINEAAKTVAVTIPYEADLANLTIVKTIVWNAPAASNSIVVNDGGAWVLGPNTYVLTDKDGDATSYTITLSRDVLRHDVTFNTHGGSAVAKQEVENGQHPTAPADPEKEDYLFQGWAETDGGAIVDVTSFAISADKEFHAVWASDGGIKLLDGEGHVNHVDFITAMTEGTVNFDDADHNCVSFSSTASTIVGASGANKFIIYNAKTNQTKIKFVLYNTQNSTQKIVLQKLAEGEVATTDVEIDVPSKERFETDFYAYNSNANRTMYVYTKNTGIKVLQVKVIEDGTPVKQAGEVGYSLNLNVGRVFAPKDEELSFEGLTFEPSSNYKVLNSTEFQTLKNVSFTIAAPVKLTLTTTQAKYYVSQNPAEDGSGTTASSIEIKETGEKSFNLLTAGTWYIVPSSTSNVKITNISFSATAADYVRDDSWMAPGELGTVCIEHGAVAVGADIYELVGRDAESGKIAFESVDVMEPGKPYLFRAKSNRIDFYYTAIAAATEPKNSGSAMKGTFEEVTLTELANVYYFNGTALWSCVDLSSLTVPEYRAYVKMDEMKPAPAPAPGRRRITLGVNGEQTATALDNLNASEKPVKLLIDGQLFIIRGEKMFDASGRLVK